MENILPAMKAVHLFGLAFWMGGAIMIYLFLIDLNKHTADYWLPVNLHLIRKSFHWLIWPGILMFLVSGIMMIALFGWSWLSPRVYLHIKIIIFILLLIPVHGLWKQYKVLQIGAESSTDADTPMSADNRPVEKIKKFLALTLTGLVINVLISIYRFGF